MCCGDEVHMKLKGTEVLWGHEVRENGGVLSEMRGNEGDIRHVSQEIQVKLEQNT